jgi:hypothetical protein
MITTTTKTNNKNNKQKREDKMITHNNINNYNLSNKNEKKTQLPNEKQAITQHTQQNYFPHTSITTLLPHFGMNTVGRKMLVVFVL